MSQREDKERLLSPSDTQKPARKPYKKPAVRFERVFETSALACGKVHVNQSGCHGAQKTS
jgi:hypothetical protein